MVEIEIGVLRGQCLDRRIGERETLTAEIEAWQRQRNASGARIKWRFTTQKARDKLARALSLQHRQRVIIVVGDEGVLRSLIREDETAIQTLVAYDAHGSPECALREMPRLGTCKPLGPGGRGDWPRAH